MAEGQRGSRIPLCEPVLAPDTLAHLQACLDEGWVSPAGPQSTRFEAAIAARCGAEHAVAVNSGTAALHLALRALLVGPNDAVVVPAISFVASANAVAYGGAMPIFVDIDPRYLQLDVDALAGLFDGACERARDGSLRHRPTGRRLAAVMAVHLLGHPCDMGRLCALCARHGVPVIEDAAEALGARCDDHPVGALGAIGCLSFNGNKTLTTGAGGMLLTRDAALAARARHLATQARTDALEQVHDEVGFNYRMPDLLAAFGLAQLAQLDGALAAKTRIARAYAEGVSDLPGVTPIESAGWANPSHWLSAVALADPEPARPAPAPRVRDALRAAGIEARCLWQPLSQSPAHRAAFVYGDRSARAAHRRVLCLPSSANLSAADQARVIAALRAAVAETGGCP